MVQIASQNLCLYIASLKLFSQSMSRAFLVNENHSHRLVKSGMQLQSKVNLLFSVEINPEVFNSLKFKRFLLDWEHCGITDVLLNAIYYNIIESG